MFSSCGVLMQSMGNKPRIQRVVSVNQILIDDLTLPKDLVTLVESYATTETFSEPKEVFGNLLFISYCMIPIPPNIKFVTIMMDFWAEVDIMWRAIKNDYNTTLIPITVYFLFSASQTYDFSIVPVLATSTLYATAYIVPFCLSNQLTGLEEDKMEKPDRPLAAGLITPYGAFVRYLLWAIFLLVISAGLGVLEWSFLWTLVTIFHNFFDGDKHFVTKNVISMTLGTAAQFGAAWHSYHSSMSQQHKLWMWMVAIWIGVLANIQDFRDVEGDKKSGRQTLPIVLGENVARFTMALFSVGGAFFIRQLFHTKSSFARALGQVIFYWHFILAARLLLSRTKRADQITYKFYLSFLYCVVVGSSFIFLE